MQKWMGQMLRLTNRQAGKKEKDTAAALAARKAAYLAKLGLAAKAQEVKDAANRPWHNDHMKAGDVFQGKFSHPSVGTGEKVDITIKLTSDKGGTWSSTNGDFDGDFEVQQDFPIVFEKGEARDEAMAAYIFHKFNAKWRDFAGPMPSAEDLEHLTLKGLQLFFYMVAEVEDFPAASTFNEYASDPEKGMTRAEFLRYIKNEDPGYLEGAFPNIYTGRRIRFGDEDLQFDGDFQVEADGKILGYTYADGTPGGTFEINLVKSGD